MKRYILFFLIASCFVLHGCTKDRDGVLYPEKKISKLFCSLPYIQDESLLQECEWNKNVLSSRKFFLDFCTPTLLQPIYIGNRIVRVNEGNGCHTDYLYEGKELSKIIWHNQDKYQFTVYFEHENGKISQIHFDGVWERLSSLKSLLPKELIESMEEQRKNKDSKIFYQTQELVIYLSWEGDNVSCMEYEYATYTDDGIDALKMYRYEYEYDNKTNPFYNFWIDMASLNTLTTSLGILNHKNFFEMILSKNNITNVTCTNTFNGKQETYTFDYEYDGDYPIRCTLCTNEYAQYSLRYEYK